MPYTTNPHLPKVRMDTVRLVRAGWSCHQAARHVGVAPSTVLRWVRRAPTSGHGRVIPTQSSRPFHHPAALAPSVVAAILDTRQQTHRCAEVIHYLLTKDGVDVSLSSVKRTLHRCGLTYPSKWKKWHHAEPRPAPVKPGVLVEIDTIHDGVPAERLYVYTLLDVCSRWAFALPVLRIGARWSGHFVQAAQGAAPFRFRLLQSDHGSEFSKGFTKVALVQGFTHRHTRVRQPNDNAHLERFNRTLQDECLSRTTRTLTAWQRAIPEYLHYYNTERPHLGLHFASPLTVLRSS